MRSRPRTRAMSTTLAAGALTLCIGLLAACSSSAESTSADRLTQVPRWDENATPASVAKQLYVKIPTEATDRRAAYQHGFQDDGLLLTFVLPTKEVNAFVEQLESEEELRYRAAPRPEVPTPMTPFSHLGLEEPDALPDVREAQVCAPCNGGLNFLRVAVHRLDDNTSRVYLAGSD